ncbi:uncharacterized protein LOC124541436 [Vanessa cardui]|uniref:uncharacterized protein LOC124541436 n=1 Tax=Vanessa cardui TaxID=171605 RepID=UPI001F131F15|nr:uncharacterized protein LOC124541436 [Vanessa cardui]
MDERKAVKGFYESVRRTLIACRIVGYFPITGGLILQAIATLSCMFLIRFSITWREMIEKIEDIEKVLPSFQNPQRIFKNINRIMLSLLLFGLVDHFMHLIKTVRMVSLCYGSEVGVSLKTYYVLYYRWVFDNVNFNYGVAFLLQCAENRRVPWMDLQAHYTRLTRLVRVIDDYINPFVFMTFLSNLVVVCKYIYDIIQRQKAITKNSYNPNCSIANSSDWIVILDSIIPTLHLIFRTTLVSTFTAHLHTLSREPLRALHTLPASAYNFEVL